MSALRANRIRFRVDPRGISADKAARRLGMTEVEFSAARDRLFARGFPRPDADTHRYDLHAIDVWMDRQAGLTSEGGARDAQSRIRSRLEELYGKGD